MKLCNDDLKRNLQRIKNELLEIQNTDEELGNRKRNIRKRDNQLGDRIFEEVKKDRAKEKVQRK